MVPTYTYNGPHQFSSHQTHPWYGGGGLVILETVQVGKKNRETAWKIKLKYLQKQEGRGEKNKKI